MDGSEVRAHIRSVVGLLSEILAEIKGLRADYAEGQAMQCAADNFTIMESFSLDLPREQYYNEQGKTE